MKNLKKRFSVIAMVLALVMGLSIGAYAAVGKTGLEKISAYLNYNITIKYNGQTVTPKDVNGNRVYPISYEGTTYLPIRGLADIFGKTVNWYGQTQTVLITD